MKFQLKAGATADTLNQAELGDSLDRHTKDWYREANRGLSTALIDPAPQQAANGAVIFPTNSEVQIGPDVGFMWKITRVSADGLATGDILKILRGSGPSSSIATGGKYVASLTLASPTYGPGHGLLLRGDQRIVVVGAGLTSTAEIVLTGEAFECSELDPNKLIR